MDVLGPVTSEKKKVQFTVTLDKALYSGGHHVNEVEYRDACRFKVY